VYTKSYGELFRNIENIITKWGISIVEHECCSEFNLIAGTGFEKAIFILTKQKIFRDLAINYGKGVIFTKTFNDTFN